MNSNTKKLYLIPSELAPGTGGEVLSEQVKNVLRELRYFFVENVRTARRFIASLRLGVEIEALQFFELHKDTSVAEIEQLFGIFEETDAVGVLSEAGCPCVADPGNRAVRYAHRIGAEVIPLTGPSSILLALMASGLNGQAFTFHGYLPVKPDERKNAVLRLERESAKSGYTQIFMETPYRNGALLETVLQICPDDTQVCIACNLTGAEQFVHTKSVREWKKNIPDLHKKPCIFLLQASR